MNEILAKAADLDARIERMHWFLAQSEFLGVARNALAQMVNEENIDHTAQYPEVMYIIAARVRGGVGVDG